MSRRKFIKTSAVATAALTAASHQTLLADEGYGGNKIPIAVQLYSVRKDCAKDLPGTLAALSKMGYKGVEFADYFKRDAKTLNQMLADNGLQCVGSHIQPLNSLMGDEAGEDHRVQSRSRQPATDHSQHAGTIRQKHPGLAAGGGYFQ